MARRFMSGGRLDGRVNPARASDIPGASLALGARIRAAPSAKGRGRADRDIAIGASVILHVLALWAFLATHVMEPPPDMEPMQVVLTPLRSVRAPRAAAAPPSPPQMTPRFAEPTRPLATRPPAEASPEAPGAATERSTAPHAAPTVDEKMANELRHRIRCQHADPASLTEVERDRCFDELAKGAATATPYAVISPRKKAIFDREHICKPDDDWCLYRSGKGPYPGLLGLDMFKTK
jgi:hypothetical protein